MDNRSEEENRKRSAKNYQRNKSKGTCSRGCGRLPVPGRYSCQSCLDKQKSVSRLRHYGITPTQYLEILDEQGYRCAICRILLSDTGPHSPDCMNIDHDHNTGQVRGVLCSVCNKKLGVVENIDWLAKAQLYLIKNRTNNVTKQ